MAVELYLTNEQFKQSNEDYLQSTGCPLAYIASENTPDIAPPSSKDDTALDLSKYSNLSVNARIMPRVNLWVQGGLVNGFTSLTEKYTQIGTTGIEELTETLNNYIGPVVARIIAAKGDVFKFAGDAILCLWPVKKERKIPSVLRTVVNCALNIQETYGILTTSLDVKLRIKFGISAGLFDFLICGKETEFIQPICVGEPIVNVQDAQNQCEPGEVIITNEAWQLLKHYHSSYTFIRIKGQFIKVLGKQFQSHTKEREAPTGKERQDLIKGCKTESQLAIISLFLLPMLRDLDAKQLEYLAEVRKITTVFMSFPEIDIIKTVGDITVVVEVVYNCTYDMQGIFNKTVCFDKGCTCLVVFGLPGYKHQDDSARGLLCASKISSKMKQHSIKCSIGITTSVTFCGIIGNSYRQEYT
ncbi:adenylate cyclase type 10-like, partial [Centruroides vittatus]